MICVNLNELLGSIIISGPDVKTFIQGQLTNDINILDDQNESGSFQYSAYLNTKGRIVANFWIKKVDINKYYLITHKYLIDKLIPKLKMYVLRAKVSIEKADKSLTFTNNLVTNNDEYIALPHNHFIIIDNNSTHDSNQHIEIFKNYIIDNGIPVIYPQTQEQLIPQHINFDELGGLNFKKGCYLGQEIVARMHYLGRSKRKMYRFSSEVEAKIGQSVMSPKLNNQEIGTIIEVIKLNQNYIGLVSLQTDCVDSAFLDIDNTQKLLTLAITYN
ncbi:MAG: YgfZ/GcvT domain-containing protein [Neisseriaceae bacterium]